MPFRSKPHAPISGRFAAPGVTTAGCGVGAVVDEVVVGVGSVGGVVGGADFDPHAAANSMIATSLFMSRVRIKLATLCLVRPWEDAPVTSVLPLCDVGIEVEDRDRQAVERGVARLRDADIDQPDLGPSLQPGGDLLAEALAVLEHGRGEHLYSVEHQLN